MAAGRVSRSRCGAGQGGGGRAAGRPHWARPFSLLMPPPPPCPAPHPPRAPRPASSARAASVCGGACRPHPPLLPVIPYMSQRGSRGASAPCTPHSRGLHWRGFCLRGLSWLLPPCRTTRDMTGGVRPTLLMEYTRLDFALLMGGQRLTPHFVGQWLARCSRRSEKK